MYDITIFGITFNINPVAFTIPFINWDVYWYGIIITLGFVLASFYGYKKCGAFGIKFDDIIDCILVVLPASIICARLYFMLFYGMPITEFFGGGGKGFSGLAIYGGIIGAALSIVVMCKIKKLKLLDVIDITLVGFLLGQGIGRWGNFFNSEAYGTFTGSSWFGMTGSKIASEMGSTALVHPCFLYESVWCLIGFFLLLSFIKKRKYSGQLALMYCVWYGFERTVVEGLRTDSLYIFGENKVFVDHFVLFVDQNGIRVSQLLSAIICLGALAALIIIKCKTDKKEPLAEVKNDN